jgi:5-carboxymethyl-2-hydroxymuconate isomerase
MPHLTLEYTANLWETPPNRELLLSLHRLLESVAEIKIENCKSRWRELDDWVVADGEGDLAFVHLDIRFLEGRQEEVKRAVGEEAVDILKAHFQPLPEGLDLQITVEVQDIRRGAYFKDPPGTLGPPPLSIL